MTNIHKCYYCNETDTVIITRVDLSGNDFARYVCSYHLEMEI